MATVRAGLVDVATDGSEHSTLSPLARIDPYPDQHRIRNITLNPPVIMPRQTRLEDAAQHVREK